MEPREKGWFNTDQNVAYFFLGSGTVGEVSGAEWSRVGFPYHTYLTTFHGSEARRFRGSEFVP
jgi:hypothetical protein